MTPKEIVQRVSAIADPILSHEGMDLVDVEYRREPRGWVLRLILDKEGGITLDDCQRISQEVGRHLDVEDFILTPYALEISSRGLDRSLKKEKDYIRYRNHVIHVKTFEPIENRRHFKGILLDAFEDRIEMEMDGKRVQIPFSNISKAHLDVNWEMAQLASGGKGHRPSSVNHA